MLLLLLGGCDFIFRIDHVSATTDAGTGDGGNSDAAKPDSPQSSACNLLTTQLLTDSELADPSQSPDQLELYMSRWDGADYNLYVATRAALGEPYSSPMLVGALSDAESDDNDPAVFNGGLNLLFSSTRGGGVKLYQSSRASLVDTWTTPILVNTGTWVVESFDVSPDGLTLYASDGSGALAVLRRTAILSDFGSAGVIGSPINWPSLPAGGLVIYYERDNAIYRATRASTVGGFGKEEGVIGGTDPDISEDGHTLVFDNGLGLAQITCN